MYGATTSQMAAADLIERTRAVDQPYPPGLIRRDLPVALADLAVELKVLLVEARVRALGAPIARVRAAQPDYRVDIDADGQIRNQSAAGDAVHIQNDFGAQIPVPRPGRPAWNR